MKNSQTQRKRDGLKMRLLVMMQRKGRKRMLRFSSIVTQRQGRMRKGAWRFVDLLGPHPPLSVSIKGERERIENNLYGKRHGICQHFGSIYSSPVFYISGWISLFLDRPKCKNFPDFPLDSLHSSVW